MRVFWLQGGVHIEPESDVETEALLVLWNAIKKERPPEFDGPRYSGAADFREQDKESQ